MDEFRDWLVRQGYSDDAAVLGALAAATVATLVLAFVGRRIGKLAYTRLVKPQKAWIDNLTGHRVFRVAAWCLALAVARELVEPTLGGWPRTSTLVHRAFDVVLMTALVVFVSRLVGALTLRFEARGEDRRIPAKALGQGLQVVIWTYGSILVVSELLHRDVTTLLTGITALGAVLVYVFRDPILGWTAGLQIAANDLARVGDWITAPEFGADGRVTDIALTTVKVDNWDRTTSTIPTYALVTRGFQNWRTMYEAGGRRFRRSLHIDAATVAVVDADRLRALNEQDLVVEAPPSNTTNLAMFRRWAQAWIAQHPDLNQELTHIVREAQPQGRGVPVEVIAFTHETDWAPHERVVADLHDHLVAVLPAFGLRLFQEPGGRDVRSLRDRDG